MKTKFRALRSCFLGLAALASAGLLVSQRNACRALEKELAALPPAPAPQWVLPPQAPPGGGKIRMPAGFAAKSGDEIRRELAGQLHAGLSSGSFLDRARRLLPALEPLSVEQLRELIGDEPMIPVILKLYDSEGAPAAGSAEESLVRFAALLRLGAVAPEQALTLYATGSPPPDPEKLIVVVHPAMREWSRKNPSAAILWAREHAAWLPPNWPTWILSTVAKEDGLPAASALARREGLLLAESMRWLDGGTLAGIDKVMTEVDRERADAPEGFLENKLVNAGYRMLAEKVCSTFGFGEGRKFAEKWTVGLPWQEDCALSAVASTLAPDSAAETTAAADWMIEFLPEERRAAAAESVLGSWSSVNPDAPLQWLAKHADSPWRDPAMAAFCRRFFTYAPERAVEWAAAIGDEALRAETLAACGK